jgi:hypothetical protein
MCCCTLCSVRTEYRSEVVVRTVQTSSLPSASADFATQRHAASHLLAHSTGRKHSCLIRQTSGPKTLHVYLTEHFNVVTSCTQKHAQKFTGQLVQAADRPVHRAASFLTPDVFKTDAVTMNVLQYAIRTAKLNRSVVADCVHLVCLSVRQVRTLVTAAAKVLSRPQCAELLCR